MITIKVKRSGDISKAAEIRCSTRDGSAMSGVDYNPKSQILKFKEGKLMFGFQIFNTVMQNNVDSW